MVLQICKDSLTHRFIGAPPRRCHYFNRSAGSSRRPGAGDLSIASKRPAAPLQQRKARGVGLSCDCHRTGPCSAPGAGLPIEANLKPSQLPQGRRHPQRGEAAALSVGVSITFRKAKSAHLISQLHHPTSRINMSTSAGHQEKLPDAITARQSKN